MKFTYGQWINREGYEVKKLTQVVDYKFQDSKLLVYIAAKPIINRGDMTDGSLITLTIASPLENIIGVNMTHYQGIRTKYPKFALNINKPSVNFNELDNKLIFKSGDTSVHVSKNPYSLEFYYKDKYMTKSTSGAGALITSPKKDFYIREQLSLGVGELVYGLGERFTPYIKNGQIIDIWNEDGGTSSEISYKNIPYYMTSKGYGVLVADTGKISFEVASEQVERVQFSVKKESLEYYMIGGENMKDTLNTYTNLSGKPPIPPAWSFGLWLSTSFTTNYDEATVNSFVDGMADRDIPLQVFHFDCFWMKEFEWCNFTWDERVFSDAKALIAKLKAKGLKICVWINPYIAQKSPMFAEGMENNYFLNNLDGSVYQIDKWQAGMAIVDFTNPKACDWYTEKLSVLLDMGVDCFKTDFGERIPTSVTYSDGSDAIGMHNYYTYLYNKTVYDLLVDKRGKNEAVLFARSATATCQQFPVHWGGDCWGTYESMSESLRGGLSLGMTGFGYWSHDIGGFEHSSPAHVYKRWVQFGLLSSHSRLHGSSSYRVPWVYDDQAVDVLRKFTKLKCSLMPYLYAQAKITSNSGLPMMRSMVLEFPDNPACRTLDQQYMLGDNLLIAPIFNESGDVTYYLPQGKWTNLLNFKVIEGNNYITENHGFMTLPLMVRENCILPISRKNTLTEYDYTDNVEFHIFQLTDGKTATAEITNIDGSKSITIIARREGNNITIKLDGSISSCYIVLHNTQSIKNKLKYEINEDSNSICLKAERTMTIQL